MPPTKNIMPRIRPKNGLIRLLKIKPIEPNMIGKPGTIIPVIQHDSPRISYLQKQIAHAIIHKSGPKNHKNGEMTADQNPIQKAFFLIRRNLISSSFGIFTGFVSDVSWTCLFLKLLSTGHNSITFKPASFTC